MLTITNFQKVNKKGFTILKYLLKILAFRKKKDNNKNNIIAATWNHVSLSLFSHRIFGFEKMIDNFI